MSEKGDYLKLPVDEDYLEMGDVKDLDGDSEFKLVKKSPDGSGTKIITVPQSVPNKEINEINEINYLNAELLKHVAENQLDEVESVLERGANANACCESTHVSALHLACFEGNASILKILLDRGAETLRADNDGRSPLHLAVRYNHSDCVELLVKGRLKLVNLLVKDEKLEKNETPNDWLDCSGHSHDFLHPELPSLEEGASSLHIASQRGHMEVIGQLLKAKADIRTTDKNGFTCLDVAGENLPLTDTLDGTEISTNTQKFTQLMKTLIDAGCRPSSSGPGELVERRYSPLHCAVELQAVEAIQLLTRSFRALPRDFTRNSPVHVAVERKLEEPFKILLQHYGRAVVNDRGARGMSPLHMAVINEWAFGVKLLLRYGPDLKAKTNYDESLLHLVAKSGNQEIMELLLKCSEINQIVNDYNSRGEPALFSAIAGKQKQCVKLLLDAKADITMVDNMNRTILHFSAEHDQPDILKCFFQNNEDACKKIIDAHYTPCRDVKFTALRLAAENGSWKCAEILLSYGSNATETMVYIDGRFGFNALHIAAAKGHSLVIDTLLRHDKSLIRVRTHDGWLPIHLACQYGLQDCVRLLLNYGADLSDKCKDREDKESTAMYLLMRRVRSPVATLEAILDESIQNSLNDTFVTVDYKVLLPEKIPRKTKSTHHLIESGLKTAEILPSECGRSNQLRVIDALMATGNHQDQHRLLRHVLIESFLHLQWSTLSWFYYALILFYSVFIIAFTAQVLMVYNYTDLSTDAHLYIIIVSWISIGSLIFLILYEVIYVMRLRFKYLFHFESWVKMTCYGLSLATCLADYVTMFWPREIAATAILLAWLEFMLLIARLPRFGYTVLMFSKVAANLFRVLLTFAFLIVGFALTFMIEFQGMPFNTPFESIIKTLVMMTSEYDYSEMFADFKGSMVSLVFAKLIFVLFLILVGIVLVNLLVAMAVTDIKDLDTQGNIERLRKQAEFVSMFERVMFDNVFINCCPGRLRHFMHGYKQVPLTLELSVVGKQDDKIQFPDKLRRAILDKAGENRDKFNKMKEKNDKKESDEKLKFEENSNRKKLLDKIDDLLISFKRKQKDDDMILRSIDRKIGSLNVSQKDDYSGINSHTPGKSPSSYRVLSEIQRRVKEVEGRYEPLRNIDNSLNSNRPVSSDKSIEMKLESLEKSIDVIRSSHQHLELVTKMNSMRAVFDVKKRDDDLAKLEVNRKLAELHAVQIDTKRIMEVMTNLISKINEVPSATRKQ